MSANSMKKIIFYHISVFILTAVFLSFGSAGATRTIRVATEQNPPLSYLDDQQRGAGLLIDLLERVAGLEGWKIEYVGCTWGRCLEILKEGQIDLLATIAYNSERAQLYDFNHVNVIANWGVLYGTPDTKISSYHDLSGKRIGVVKGDSHQHTLRNMLSQFGVSVTYIELENFAAVFAALEERTVEAGVVGRFYALKNDDKYAVKVTPLVFNPIQVHYAAPKGRNTDLLQAIDTHLTALKSAPDSYYYRALDRWLGVVGKRGMPKWLWVVLWSCAGALTITLPTLLVLRYQVRNRTLRLEQEELKRQQAQQALRFSENRLRSIIDTTSEGFWMIDPETRQTIAVNDALCRMLGYSREEMLGKTPLEFADESGRQIFRQHTAWTGTASHRSYEVSLLSRDGHEIATIFNASTLCEESGIIAFAFVTDITDIKRSEQSLLESERKYRELVENANSIILRMNAEGVVTFFNEYAESFFGFSKDEIVGRNVIGTIVPEAESASRNLVKMAQEIGRYPQLYLSNENENSCKDGSRVWVSWSNRAILDNNGRVSEVLCIGQDITKRREYEEQLIFHTNFDVLTGLPNRTLLADRISQAKILEDRFKGVMAIMLLDLDNFKMINDTLGHLIGDKLLTAVARRLLSVVRTSDTVARLGGDEFIVLHAELPDNREVARLAEKLLFAFTSPFEVDGHELFISASMGISLYPGDGDTTEELIQHADVAMYHAKDLGKNNFQFFTDEINCKVHERMMLETMLRRALERDEFLLHYQPQVCMSEGRIAGIEALLRWQPEGERVIGPSVFIPILEETGLIVPVGYWVLRKACNQLKAWHACGLPQTCLSVNISARQFHENDLPEQILSILQETGFEPQFLRLELTESLLMGDVAEIAGKLNTLNNMGITLSVDDFGTGYSSLSYLQQLPISELKIDRSFVRNLPHNLNDAAIVNTIIGMAQSLNMNVVAEGVESTEQLAFLQSQSCQEVQGFFFSRPLPPHEMAALLATGNFLKFLRP